MKKTILACILSTGCVSYCIAQSTDPLMPDAKKEKTTDQYVGVQINGLIRQVFNFNNSTTTTNTNVNPYLLTYNINSKKTGWGLRLGIGYNYNATKTNDNVTINDNKINDMQLRVGVERAFVLSKKWSAGAGIDFAYNTNNDVTTATVTAFDTITTKTKDVISSYGGGAMGWLRYNITDRILIGTEASFYYLTGKEKVNTDITITDFNGSSNTQSTKTDNKISSGTISLPVVFYLSVKF